MSCSGEIVAENDLLQIKPAVTKKLKKAKYGIADHSTVELCHWTKKSFRGEGNCYKHKFYGISTHQCMEFSPAGMYCQNRCVYCWRPMEFYESMEMDPNKVAAIPYFAFFSFFVIQLVLFGAGHFLQQFLQNSS